MIRRSLTLPPMRRLRRRALRTLALSGTLVLACQGACGGTGQAPPTAPSAPSLPPPQAPSPPVTAPINIAAADWDQGLVDPAGPRRVGLWVNTATGSGAPQVQAFPALVAYNDSARESVGMYGNVYDMTIALSHDGAGTLPRRVRVLFASLATAGISRYWDGYGLVDGQIRELRHVPGNQTTTLADVELTPASPTRVLRFRAMVPGVTSIPQALWLESR